MLKMCFHASKILFSILFLAHARKKAYLCPPLYAYMRTTSFLFLLLCMTAGLWATPAERITRLLRLTDGTEVLATLYGDEYASWYETADGRIIQETAEGFVLQAESPVTMRAAARKVRSAAVRRISGSQADASLPAQGSPRIPVILVNFQDSVFHVKPTNVELCAYYDLYCNGTRNGQYYKGHGSYGAIRDYYSDQSKGQFTPEFVVVGVVTLSGKTSDYGADSSSKNKDKNFGAFCKEAITKAMEAYDLDWMQFNNRGKNRVDMVFFVFAGCGQNTGGPSTTLWPKWGELSGVTVNGVTFYSALCGAENMALTNDNGYIVGVKPDGIGVLCHEMNHALGLPDFYDTNYKAFGMDIWSIMDYGQYGGNSYIPVSMTAYEREFMGWEEMEELTEAGWITLEPTATTGKGYKIVNAQNPNEYYIIENRQRVGWDEGVGRFGHGLMVTHVDYDATAWRNNNVNTGSDRLLYESLTTYTNSDDSSVALLNDNSYLDNKDWATLTNIYPGGAANAYINGGCLILGSDNAPGTLTSKSLVMKDTGTLKFYIKKYGTDMGKVNVAVTGAVADVTEFTPTSNWKLCTVNLTPTTSSGVVTITLATISGRAYLDEITLDVQHQRMTIIAANNRYYGTCVAKADEAAELIKTWSGNCYPFEENDSLTASSIPAATVYTPAGFMYKDLHGICEQADNTVVVYFGEGYDLAVGVETIPQDGVPAKDARRAIYDLTGRRVARPATSGLYIVDGRKVFISK